MVSKTNYINQFISVVVVNIRWLVDIIGNIRRKSELCMAW